MFNKYLYYRRRWEKISAKISSNFCLKILTEKVFEGRLLSLEGDYVERLRKSVPNLSRNYRQGAHSNIKRLSLSTMIEQFIIFSTKRRLEIGFFYWSAKFQRFIVHQFSMHVSCVDSSLRFL